ncbi:response regulator [Petroclostridium sp. X23]|uniref:response regulator n=1 Tax=Petroclostridium sp. X23 TaxID=3045146 RepID=UPI0024AD05B6|nr:response regulator [Petroclostridium sp. X23]WHH59519.1 response regulator [Petroclostridium sp. X23]
MSYRILVIDDTKNIRMMVSKCLVSENYTVDAADNGYDGIKLFKDHRYDLVMLDIRMPELSGTEVLKILKGINKDIPVIIITAFPTIKNAVECVKLGAIDYIRKPFTSERIKETVLSLINRANINELDVNDYKYLLEYAKKCINNLEFDKALNYLKKAVSININDGEPFNLMGNICEIQEDFINAQKYYNIALVLDPNSEIIAENLARIAQY